MKQRVKIYVVVAVLASCGCVCYDSAVDDLRTRYDTLAPGPTIVAPASASAATFRSVASDIFRLLPPR